MSADQKDMKESLEARQAAERLQSLQIRAHSTRQSPLSLALRDSFFDCVPSLIATTSDINHTTSWDNGRTALMYAIENPDCPREYIQLIIQRGALLNSSEGDEGSTALLSAIALGRTGVVVQLVKAIQQRSIDRFKTSQRNHPNDVPNLRDIANIVREIMGERDRDMGYMFPIIGETFKGPYAYYYTRKILFDLDTINSWDKLLTLISKLPRRFNEQNFSKGIDELKIRIASRIADLILEKIVQKIRQELTTPSPSEVVVNVTTATSAATASTMFANSAASPATATSAASTTSMPAAITPLLAARQNQATVDITDADIRLAEAENPKTPSKTNSAIAKK